MIEAAVIAAQSAPDAISCLAVLAQAVAEPTHGNVLWAYGIFGSFILFGMTLDLGVFHRKAHVVSAKEAMGWTAFWVSSALLFGVAVYFMYENHWLGLGLEVPVLGKPGETATVTGFEAARNYVLGYIVEQSLSIDNVFVISLLFTSLGIPAIYQHRVLFWGILGAIIMRGVMILVGVSLVQNFAWITYVFGGFLILTAGKMALIKSHGSDPKQSPVVRLFTRFLPVTDELSGQKFLVRIDGRLFATPLLLALVLVEFTDLIFAVDSIPAIFSITADPFIVFTSNIFAIVGLRSLYFCVAALIRAFRYLKPALIFILAFIGVKMCLVHTAWKIGPEVSFIVVLGVLAVGIGASLLLPVRDVKPADEAA